MFPITSHPGRGKRYAICRSSAAHAVGVQFGPWDLLSYAERSFCEARQNTPRDGRGAKVVNHFLRLPAG